MADHNFPEIFADGVQVGAGAYGVSLTFFLSDPEESGSPGPIAGRVRLSKDLALALRSTIEMAIAKAPAPTIKPDEGGE